MAKDNGIRYCPTCGLAMVPEGAAHVYCRKCDRTTPRASALTAADLADWSPPEPLPPMWAHQVQAIEKLTPMGSGLLAFDTGTGKSRTALALAEAWDARFTLLVCPGEMCLEWPRDNAKWGYESWRWLPLSQGSGPKRAKQLQVGYNCSRLDGRPFVVTINYEAVLSKAIAPVLEKLHWDLLLLDESHKVKQPDGKTSLFLWQLSKRVGHCELLSATPFHERPEDAFAQFRIIDESVFGTDYWAFFNHYCYTRLDALKDELPDTIDKAVKRIVAARDKGDLMPLLDGTKPEKRVEFEERFGALTVARIASDDWPPKQAERDRVLDQMGRNYVRWRLKRAPQMRTEVVRRPHMAEMQRRMAPYIVVARKRDVLKDLPDVLHVERLVVLDSKSRRIYEDMKADHAARIGTGEITRSNVLASTTALREIANGFYIEHKPLLDEAGEPLLDDKGKPKTETIVHQVGTEKRDALVNVFESLAYDEPVAVFAEFHHDMDVIHEAAKKAGRTSCEQTGRAKQFRQWRDGKFNVLALHPKSGGAGIPLTRAWYQVYFAHPQSLLDYDQTLGRIDRNREVREEDRGRKVTYIHIAAAGTIDDDVSTALQTKADLAEAVMKGLRGK